MTRQFRDISQYQLASSITNSATTVTLGTLLSGRGLSGLAAPYTLVLSDSGGLSREVVNVNSTASFPTLGIDRGLNGTGGGAGLGNAHAASDTATMVVGENDLQSFPQLDGAQQTGQINVDGQIAGATLKAYGLTGAQAASRHAGSTAVGAPTTGPFNIGDYVVDHAGSIWICTTSGSPGVWAQVGATITGESSSADIKATGLTGATAASRYVGATTSGAPASGTFLKGDYVIDQTGVIWVCTTAGSPGTWTQIASGGGGTGVSLNQIDTPANHGYLAWTCDPGLDASGSGAAGNQKLYLLRIYVQTGGVATKLYTFVNAGGVTMTTNGNFAGIYDTSFNLLGTTGAQDGVWISANLMTMSLTSSVTLVSGTSYYLALLASATTMPTFAKASSVDSRLVNAGLSATAPATARVLSRSSITGSLPASGGTYVSDVPLFWMAVGV